MMCSQQHAAQWHDRQLFAGREGTRYLFLLCTGLGWVRKVLCAYRQHSTVEELPASCSNLADWHGTVPRKLI